MVRVSGRTSRQVPALASSGQITQTQGFPEYLCLVNGGALNLDPLPLGFKSQTLSGKRLSFCLSLTTWMQEDQLSSLRAGQALLQVQPACLSPPSLPGNLCL